MSHDNPLPHPAAGATPTATLVSRFLDSDLSAGECLDLLSRLRSDAEARDQFTVMQLLRDAVAGVRALDDGYSQRILERIRRGDRPREF